MLTSTLRLNYLQRFCQPASVMLRARVHKATCSFAAAAGDLRALLDLRPGHKSATRELLEVDRGQEALAGATAAVSR